MAILQVKNIPDDLPLLTADGRLARAPNLGIVVQSVRMG